MAKSTHLYRYLGASLSLLMIPSLAVAGSPDIYEPSLLPSDPRVGHCYTRVEIPAQFQTSTRSVLVQEAYPTTHVTQPKLASRTQQVEIKEPSVRYEVRQPVFKSISEQMMVRPAYDRLSVSTPRFETVTETIQTSGARRVWKMGNPAKLRSQGYRILSTADGGPAGRGYRTTTGYGARHGSQGSASSITQQFGGAGATRCGDGCEIWCLVEEPGEQVSFNRKVLVSGGTVRRVPVPAKYTTITKQVVSDPGGVREIPVAAQYRTVHVEELVEMGREYTNMEPEKYGEVQTRALVSPSRYEWREVVCNSPQARSGVRSGSQSSYYSGRALTGSSLSGTSMSGHTMSGGYSSIGHSSAGHSSTGQSTRHINGNSQSYLGSKFYGQSGSHGQSGSYGQAEQAPARSYYYGSDKPVSRSHQPSRHGVHRKRRH